VVRRGWEFGIPARDCSRPEIKWAMQGCSKTLRCPVLMPSQFHNLSLDNSSLFGGILLSFPPRV
jgi:hypothetical protein